MLNLFTKFESAILAILPRLETNFALAIFAALVGVTVPEIMQTLLSQNLFDCNVKSCYDASLSHFDMALLLKCTVSEMRLGPTSVTW